ncbi:hypothetical protein DPMN_107961 [Dreissena polymorpha]|uniref:Uncharacterized protein n=1 Tax=Dreissena polymorpha TaxID=45954 RepID=A0A9D4QKN3_DREPO|nr:hypothetical protein DPMN_107961 [Dreissena polymorpha]
MIVTFRVLNRKSDTPTDWAIIVTFRPFTRKIAPPLAAIKNAQPLAAFVFNQPDKVLTMNNAPPPCGHVFQQTGVVFKLVQDIFGTNFLTKFHENRKIIIDFRVLTRKYAPSPCGHVFQPTENIFELFHKDRKKMKKCPAPGNHVFQPTETNFELANVDAARPTTYKRRSQKLTMSTLCSRELKTPEKGYNTDNLSVQGTQLCPKSMHQHTVHTSSLHTVFTSLELDQARNVTSRVFISQNVDDGRRTTQDGQKMIPKAHHEHYRTDRRET